jgi:enoyl-CoA hydratase/carnithine racemase
MHLSTPKVEEISSKDTQQTNSSGTNDEVKFDYINKTGIIQLNKPKTLNALSLPMIEKIYPKMKV